MNSNVPPLRVWSRNCLPFRSTWVSNGVCIAQCLFLSGVLLFVVCPFSLGHCIYHLGKRKYLLTLFIVTIQSFSEYVTLSKRYCLFSLSSLLFLLKRVWIREYGMNVIPDRNVRRYQRSKHKPFTMYIYMW
jgi:Mn2+/Fe2+ NRAMP family transporter